MDTRDLVLNASQLSGFDCTYTAWFVCMSVWYRLTQRQHNTEKRKQSHKFCSYLHMCIVFHQFFLLSRRLFLHVSTYTHTHPFNGLFSGTTRVSRYQKGKTNLDFTGARDSEWQWHQLGICKSAPRSRQITTPAPHRSVSYRPDALPAAQPTVSKHWRHIALNGSLFLSHLIENN